MEQVVSTLRNLYATKKPFHALNTETRGRICQQVSDCVAILGEDAVDDLLPKEAPQAAFSRGQAPTN